MQLELIKPFIDSAYLHGNPAMVVISYTPQIYLLWMILQGREPPDRPAKAISLWAYLAWCCGAAITTLFGHFNDVMQVTVNGGVTLAANLLVVALILLIRSKPL